MGHPRICLEPLPWAQAVFTHLDCRLYLDYNPSTRLFIPRSVQRASAGCRLGATPGSRG